MKKFIKISLVAVLFSWPLLAELSIQNIEKMVEDIKAKRKSKMKDRNISLSPFIVIKNDENSSVKKTLPVQETKATFVLGAIINSSAFIDGKWYQKGDQVGDFNLTSIEEDHVVLKKENRIITLFFRKAKQILNISEEQK